MANVKIFSTPVTLAQAAAECFLDTAEKAIQERGLFSVSLSGGSSPQMLYRLLATEPYSERADWSRVHFFFGDERCVPPDHPESNFRKARQNLFDHIPVPEENIHRILAERKPEESAEAYEETLLKFFSSLSDEEDRTRASFDLVLLGMGDDGHTASLFPGTPAIHEETRWVIAQYIDRLAAWRITLTPAILNRATHVLFLVEGAAKSWTLQKVIYGAYQPDRYPAQVIRPSDGDVVWMVDEAAATYF